MEFIIEDHAMATDLQQTNELLPGVPVRVQVRRH